MKVRWTLLATADFNEAKHFIASEHPVAARRLAGDLTKLLMRLRRYPYLGKPGREENLREIYLSRFPYMVAYQVKDNNIDIIRFLHDRQSWTPTDES